MIRITTTLVVLSLSLGALAGCGGGSAAQILGAALEQTLPVHQPDRSGSLSELGEQLAIVQVGDNLRNEPWRGFVSFRMADPLPGHRVKEATLRLEQVATFGAPYVELGPMAIDRVESGVALTPFDYHRVALAQVAGIPDAAPGARSMDVTALVQDAVDDDERVLDFRFRFLTPASVDAAADLALLTGGGAGADVSLTVTWERIP